MERGEATSLDSLKHRRRPFKRSTTTVCACRSEDPWISLFARAVSCILCSCLQIPRFGPLRDRYSSHWPDPFAFDCAIELRLLCCLLREMASRPAEEFGQEEQFSQVRIRVALKTLQNVREGRLTRGVPPQIKDSRGHFENAITDAVARDWIKFGMPPIIVYRAQFANSRFNESFTGKAVHLLHSMMKCCKDGEKTCSGAQFIRKGERFLKVFHNACRGPAAAAPFLDEDMYHRFDEFWGVVCLQLVPKPMNEVDPVTEVEKFLAGRIQLYGLATVIESEPHPGSWLAVTRTGDYTKIMREIMQINPGSEDPNQYYEDVKKLLKKEVNYLGLALRFHNMNFPNEKIILQDVMLDFAGTVRDHGKGRSAAQNNLMCIIALTTRLERMKIKAHERIDTYWKVTLCQNLQNEVTLSHDIPDDILLKRGFNVSISLKRGATVAEAHRFENCKLPLEFGDNRLPEDTDTSPYEYPEWIDPSEDFMTEEEKSRAEAAARGSVHDIETGVQNIGVKAFKVFQMAYEQRNLMRKPEAFYSLFTSAAEFLMKLKREQKNTTVHIWLSFNTFIKGHERRFEEVVNYVDRVASFIEELQVLSPTPLFVSLLNDANFLGSKTSITPLVEELATRLRSVGILHSKNEKFWRGMRACGGDPHFWKQGEKKEIMWAYMEICCSDRR
eukprot:s103_g46.t1